MIFKGPVQSHLVCVGVHVLTVVGSVDICQVVQSKGFGFELAERTACNNAGQVFSKHCSCC